MASDHLELLVSPESAGERLDHFLVSLLPNRSRSQLQKLIKDGRVRIGSRALRPNTPVKAGDTVVVEIPPPTPATLVPEDLPLQIAYEDSDLLVVDKPAGMVVHPGAGIVRGTLVHALLHRVRDLSGIGGEERPGIVHRLDRGTSGLMVIAKNDEAHLELSRQFHDREVEKEYVALVWGLVNAGRRIDAPIGRHPSRRALMSARARRARSAVTRITKARHLRGLTLVHVAIATGRTHQIRVHLSSIGHPIAGDPLYGGVKRHLAADHRPLARLERPFLHAARLAFAHPRDHRKMEFTSELPDDLRQVLEQLEGR
ncbi:MAG: RluA family pseudouridine synthase [Acidobacteria bacterium]|nr:RluA family pseudouridine synthase [Acidobacteriota bacterium]